ncbi:MAG: pimeloyl-ACP methyl ester esterase BioH [Gammaproteobacteria bacterium]
MFVNSVGQGQDLVLLHGWAMHGGVFDSLVKKLQLQYRVHIIDLPGFGFSREENGIYTLDEITDILISDFQERGLNNIILIGWSLGGLIAQNICLRHSELVSKLVLVASIPKFVFSDNWKNGIDESLLSVFHTSMQDDYRKTVLRFLSLQVLGDELAMLQLRLLRQEIFTRGEPNPDALKNGLLLLQNTDLRDRVDTITQQCLLVGGSQDQIVLVDAIKDSIKLFPNAEYKIVEKSAHGLFLSHEPQFLVVLKEFLDDK